MRCVAAAHLCSQRPPLSGQRTQALILGMGKKRKTSELTLDAGFAMYCAMSLTAWSDVGALSDTSDSTSCEAGRKRVFVCELSAMKSDCEANHSCECERACTPVFLVRGEA